MKKNKTPYDTIAEPIVKWCEENYYTDFIVTISIDDGEITEILEVDPLEDECIWVNDWWEGQKDVKLLGFVPISDIHVYGIPPEADIQPVKRAMWKRIPEYTGSPWGYFECTNCGERSYTLSKNYCPNCGAKMDGER